MILYDEQETTVQANGDIETMYRRAYLILRPDGKQYGIVAVPFDNETKITWMKAWCIPKEGKNYELKEKDAVEVGDQDSFYSDHRSKVLEIPAPTPGNVVGYEYRQKKRPFFLQDEWWIQERIPVLHSRFILNLPAGWEFSAKWMNHAELKPSSQTATQIVWDADHISGIKKESAMPTLSFGRRSHGRHLLSFRRLNQGARSHQLGTDRRLVQQSCRRIAPADTGNPAKGKRTHCLRNNLER